MTINFWPFIRLYYLKVSEPYSNDLLMAVRILREVLQREKMGQSFDLTNTKDRYFLENLVEITSSILEPRPAMTTHWIKVISAYKTTAVSELLQDYDDYIANLADNMATKFVTAGMDPFQIVTDNMGELVITFLVSLLRRVYGSLLESLINNFRWGIQWLRATLLAHVYDTNL